MNRRALLLVNQHARQAQKFLPQAIAQLQSCGFELLQEDIQDVRHVHDVIQGYKKQIDLVIVGGGDGTLNTVVDSLVNAELPLGILPLGTANDLARTLGIPTLVAACNAIAQGHIEYIDLGLVNDKHFFNVASIGLSVHITQKLTKEVKRRWGVFAYALTAFQALWQARPFTAEICLNERSLRVKTIQIAVGNGRYYGGGMTVFHDATIDDQRLDLYSLELKHWWQILALLPAMRSGKHRSSQVRVLHGQEIEVFTRKPRPINTDGEITTYTPAHFRVLPRALAVIVPKDR